MPIALLGFARLGFEEGHTYVCIISSNNPGNPGFFGFRLYCTVWSRGPLYGTVVAPVRYVSLHTSAASLSCDCCAGRTTDGPKVGDVEDILVAYDGKESKLCKGLLDR